MSEKNTLVLSGGAVKGFYILGALQALIDDGKLKNIKNYFGTSVGSTICYLLAIGYTPIELMVIFHTDDFLEKLKHFDPVSMINGNGALPFAPIHEFLEKLTLKKIGKFLTLKKLEEEFGKKLFCTTYNMTINQTEYISPDNYPDIPCLTALRMSCNLPIFFERFKYMDSYYIDGGITDNFPLTKAQEYTKDPQSIIGVKILYSHDLKDNPEEGIISYFLKILKIHNMEIVKSDSKEKNESVVFEVETKGQTYFEFSVDSKEKLEMFSKGYTVGKGV